jgi:AcrR family transcriptional regulator
MARKSRKQAAPRAKRSANIDDPIVAAALDEAAALGWRETTLAGIADRAGMTLGALLLETPSKAHVVMRFAKDLDRATLSPVTAPDLSQSARDRVFEVLMRRFDALSRNRAGARAIVAGVCRDPAAGAALLLRAHRSSAAILAAAGISTDGLAGLARIHGLKIIFLAALRAWMRDDTDDMAATMAALDKALRQAERAMRFVSPGRWRGAADGEAEAA